MTVLTITSVMLEEADGTTHPLSVQWAPWIRPRAFTHEGRRYTASRQLPDETWLYRTEDKIREVSVPIRLERSNGVFAGDDRVRLPYPASVTWKGKDYAKSHPASGTMIYREPRDE